MEAVVAQPRTVLAEVSSAMTAPFPTREAVAELLLQASEKVLGNEALAHHPAKASSVARYLAKLGEPTDVPTRSPSRGPPYWKSPVLRRKASGGDE